MLWDYKTYAFVHEWRVGAWTDNVECLLKSFPSCIYIHIQYEKWRVKLLIDRPVCGGPHSHLLVLLQNVTRSSCRSLSILRLLWAIMLNVMTANVQNISCEWARSDMCIINVLSQICGRHKCCQPYVTATFNRSHNVIDGTVCTFQRQWQMSREVLVYTAPKPNHADTSSSLTEIFSEQ